ncbi:hypothetical protein FDA94_26065 [Herbidospora galbida]|uniref:Fis family transcriptional regulator n=1 Tax=Herbidospora galbida TaxID=2575442 RepID=A0A4U3MCM6_9ACTN|nr:HU-CCDC81 and SPOR domain-containing protein [Herbidospora galbida]TKK85376.1 hypothetical protein FDA94_26065 [Herbidospora galbida]
MSFPDGPVHNGVPLLTTLATALLKLETHQGLEGFTLPYPAEAQRALDRTVLACLLRGAQPPASLAQLLDWCRERPISDWPLDLPADLVSGDDRLLDPLSGRPTELCHEWSERSRDSAAEYLERLYIREALTRCRDYGEEDAYSAFRRLLVERPVLTAAEFFEVLGDLQLEPVHHVIGKAYVDVPRSFARDGRFVACGRCLTLLVPTRDGGWWCERDRCQRFGPPPAGRELLVDEVGELRQLMRPLRQFVTGPGRAEIDLETALGVLGVHVQMWPGFDSYDLRVTFPDGWVWAIDVKDWASPVFLGRSARPVPAEPPYDEAFWVVPDHRATERHDYVDVFKRHRPSAAGGLVLRTHGQTVKRAKARLRAQRVGNDA